VKTHNEIFEDLQKNYIYERDVTHNEKAASDTLGKMYQICVTVSQNYIKKYQLSRGLRLDIETLAHDAALYIIEQYLRKPSFRVKKVSAYAYFGCTKALFTDSRREQNEVSYEQYFTEKEEANY
jgi:hypothetical protein